MKHPKFKSDIKTLNMIEKVCEYIKEFCYSLYLPYEITGSVTSPTKYIQFKDYLHKDLVIRVSNHKSHKKYCNSDDVFNIIVNSQLPLNKTIIKQKIKELEIWLNKKTEGGF